MAKSSFGDNLKTLQKSFSDILQSEHYVDEWLSTNVISVNLLFSGKIKGGIKKGTINTIAAPSAEGKSLIGLNVLKSAQKNKMNCIVIDSERAFNRELATKLGIDVTNLFVFQTTGIGDIKKIYAQACAGLTAAERRNIFVLFDSWGPLTFTGLIDKAEKGTDTADMGRTAQFKNELANIINSYGTTTFCVNHVYDNMAMFASDKYCIPGGKRLFYLSDGIMLAQSEAQWKNDDGTYIGKIVTAGVKKGRSAKERCKVKFLIRANGALDPFYGLLDDAIDAGVVTHPRGGYTRPNYDTDGKLWKEEDLYCPAFWIPLYTDETFNKFISDKYTFESSDLIASKIDVMDLIENGLGEEPTEDDLYEEVPNDPIQEESAAEPVEAPKKGKKKKEVSEEVIDEITTEV